MHENEQIKGSRQTLLSFEGDRRRQREKGSNSSGSIFESTRVERNPEIQRPFTTNFPQLDGKSTQSASWRVTKLENAP